MRNGNRIVRDRRRKWGEFGFFGSLKAGHQKQIEQCWEEFGRR